MQEMHAIITGRVQGVGFRATTKFLADRLKITGFARNLADGSVEICAQGEKKNLEELLAQLKKEFDGRITATEVQIRPILQADSSFKIR